jgi:hypothetical protein
MPLSTPTERRFGNWVMRGHRERPAWARNVKHRVIAGGSPVRATWAPKGHTPVLRHRFCWTRLSMSGALAYRVDASQAALVFQIKEGSYNTDSLIEFLIHTCTPTSPARSSP